jgi:nitroimidazol reductase NimA-like FMN-containing flavoprotein (pyridoxamine 5'-phosphate oxidase superfamily)
MYFHDAAPGLSEAECQNLLAGESLGRVSLTIGGLPVVMPVNYGYLGGSIILGMNDGPAQRSIADGNIIALGVDSGRSGGDFWALLVIGRTTEITDPEQQPDLQRIGLTDLTGTAAAHFLQLQPDIIAGYRTVL